MKKLKSENEDLKGDIQKIKDHISKKQSELEEIE